MLRGTASRLSKSGGAGFENWPWPARLPLSGHWFNNLKPTSISKDVRGVQRFGDILTVGLVAFFAYRAWDYYRSGAYQSRLKHLTGTAPAIIAQDFDFNAAPRQVSRERLEEYRQEFAAAKLAGKPVESFIFKY
jgi:hypothetical protein